ncbi:hypothetical protein ACFQL7_27395 [Halocatena marina]|uniref:Uncharacterized protein n=1 Tax=Halocatena marina TaxID=2934937 RepID=A0ABD5YU38_9EURY
MQRSSPHQHVGLSAESQPTDGPPLLPPVTVRHVDEKQRTQWCVSPIVSHIDHGTVH